MHMLKLTVFIEDHADLAMEVHVVPSEHREAIADAAPRERGAKGIDDDYELGGYAGI